MIPFIVVVVACVGAVVVLRRRRTRVVGFDIGEASSYVWDHLDREQRQGISIRHVVAMLEAEKDAPDDTDDLTLRALIRGAGEGQGARLRDEDIETILDLQFRYAEAKGLL